MQYFVTASLITLPNNNNVKKSLNATNYDIYYKRDYYQTEFCP